MSPELLLVDKHHIALLAGLQALVDGLDVVKQVVPTLERLVTALAVEDTLTVDSLQTVKEFVKLKETLKLFAKIQEICFTILQSIRSSETQSAKAKVHTIKMGIRSRDK